MGIRHWLFVVVSIICLHLIPFTVVKGGRGRTKVTSRETRLLTVCVKVIPDLR